MSSVLSFIFYLGSRSGSVITDPRDTSTHTPLTSTHTPLDSTQTRTSTDHARMNVSTPVKQLDGSSVQTGGEPSEAAPTWDTFCVKWFPLVQIMQLQV